MERGERGEERERERVCVCVYEGGERERGKLHSMFSTLVEIFSCFLAQKVGQLVCVCVQV